MVSGRGQERGSAERLPTLTMKWSPLVWSVVSGQWSVVSGQWTGSGTGLGGETAHAYNEVVTISLVSGQWSVVSGQWTGSGTGLGGETAHAYNEVVTISLVSGQWSVDGVGVRNGARRRDCPRLQ